MAYFRDLSHCTYFQIYPANWLAVGWLSSSFAYSQGAVSTQFLSALEQLTKKPVHLCLGTHDCEFCQIPKEIVGLEQGHKYRWDNKLLGNGEIHVPGARGIVYVAPILVYHYVKEHQYKPPEEFIQAVETWWEKEKLYKVGLLDGLLLWWRQRRKTL